MGSDKIFMFDNPAAGESAGIMSMIPALLQNKGLDPNLVAALMNGNKNQDAWGGAGCYWIWIILLFFLWGGNGFGNGFGNGANGIPAQLNNEAGRELLMNAIQGNGTAINQLITFKGMVEKGFERYSGTFTKVITYLTIFSSRKPQMYFQPHCFSYLTEFLYSSND